MKCNTSCTVGIINCGVECYSQGMQLSDGVGNTLSVLLGIITVTSILSNLFLLCLIGKSKCLHTMPNLFIMNLAIGDLLNSIILLPLDLDEFARGYFAYSEPVCTLVNMVFYISLPASSVNLVLLTFERYIIIKFPFYHGRLFTKTKAAILLTVIWGYVCILGLFAVSPVIGHVTVVKYGLCTVDVSDSYVNFWIIANLAVPIGVIIGLNIQIFRAANCHLQEMKRRQQSIIMVAMRKQSVISNVKAAKTTVLLVGVFIVCWLPYLIMNVINNICGLSCYVRYRPVLKSLIVLNYSNMTWNPILYGTLNKGIREEAKSTLRKILFRKGVMQRKKISRVSADNTAFSEATNTAKFSKVMIQNFEATDRRL